MVQDFCPKCGAKTSPTDTQCLDCGADLQVERAKLRRNLHEQSVSGRTGKNDEPKIAVRSAASAGRAAPGESSKETRLKVFDKQAAEHLKEHALVCLALGIGSGVLGLILLGVGLPRLSALGFAAVWGQALEGLYSFDTLFGPPVVAVDLTGIGLAGVLIGAGMLLRYVTARQAVRDVEAGEKPEIVALSLVLQLGLYALVIFLAPAALIIGFFLRTSQDTDMAGFGTQMIWLSLAVIALIVGDILIRRLVVTVGSDTPPAVLAPGTGGG
jgi:hypothetical protein